MPHGYPEGFCEHGQSNPEYCGECLATGKIPPFIRKGTGNEALLTYSPYIYIYPPKSKKHTESKPENCLVTELEQQNDVTPSRVRSDSVEVLRPSPRPQIEEPKIEQELCPHNGPIVEGLPYCGYCLKMGSPEQFKVFLIDLYNIARHEGHRFTFGRIDYLEQTHHAYMAIMRQLEVILKAENPPALARIVARNAIKDLKKKPTYKKEWRLFDLPGGQDLEREDARADSLVTDPSYALLIDPEHARAQVGGSDFNIPGGELLWQPRCYRQIECLLEGAMASLPKPPEDKVPMQVSLMIKLWVGYFEDLGAESYEVIARRCPTGTKAHQVKYAIQTGLDKALEYIKTHADEANEAHGVKRPWLQDIEKKRLKK